MYDKILEDLQKTFGDRKFLSPADIAPIIYTSTQTQANMRSKGIFPLPTFKQGKKVGITIYALADWLAINSQLPTKSSPKQGTSSKIIATPRPVKIKKGKNDWIIAFRENLEFNQNLATHLEKIALQEAVGIDPNQKPFRHVPDAPL